MEENHRQVDWHAHRLKHETEGVLALCRGGNIVNPKVLIKVIATVKALAARCSVHVT
jgi:hypothetical protein